MICCLISMRESRSAEPGGWPLPRGAKLTAIYSIVIPQLVTRFICWSFHMTHLSYILLRDPSTKWPAESGFVM
jgi:hypothetical protein